MISNQRTEFLTCHQHYQDKTSKRDGKRERERELGRDKKRTIIFGLDAFHFFPFPFFPLSITFCIRSAIIGLFPIASISSTLQGFLFEKLRQVDSEIHAWIFIILIWARVKHHYDTRIKYESYFLINPFVFEYECIRPINRCTAMPLVYRIA